jgi:ligand-binding SRPBCC domain-containing protein
MTHLYLETIINAPMEICFDLSRSIDLHQFTTKQTGEHAIAGKISGLIEKDEFVTWEATHFFIKQKLTTKIVEMSQPNYFIDVMTDGAFKSMWHRHSFSQNNSQKTVMTDEFKYETPFGIFGDLFNRLVLKGYMVALLKERNEIIKNVAESEEWKIYLRY